MGIRDVLLAVASTYDRRAGTGRGVVAQDLLRGLQARSDLGAPAGLLLKGYGGSGSASSTPWIGVYDPDVTIDPKEGLYLAYIFASDLTSVTLTLQQGVTQLEKLYGAHRDLYGALERKASVLLAALPGPQVEGWIAKPELRGDGWRPRAYEASSVVARRYDLAVLSSEQKLIDDLWHASGLLQLAAGVEKSMVYQAEPDGLAVHFAPSRHDPRDLLDGFKPKNSSDYIAEIQARRQRKSRRHEYLIAEFGPYAEERGFKPTTEKQHPRDLVLTRQLGGRSEWLVEVKVVESGSPTRAVRDALSQLLEYSHFLYGDQGPEHLHLVGLFTEDIGPAFTAYLEKYKIASVWRTRDGWSGSPLAKSWGLTP
ncbi:DUF3578 domain-containing protein [Streptomyces sp. NBC_00047]|uniref:MrcB family domain-containing protein n=1 Tax=Streptomyces sp. NBC_00047 TaxID=2975627 RepID=UPI00224CD131|nr:DUF3578 domain-containing protein [Streptomyces sp. NBC_00047]MCX5607764.1 DUF3578 domain-containing protein [Streptomyces sp. NBC_00047]